MSTATEMRDFYLAAEQTVLAGQTVRFGDRLLTHANLTEIQAGRREWERKVAAEQYAANGAPTLRRRYANFSGVGG